MTENFEDKLKEIERLGDAFNILYAKCWNTAIDCYTRHFPNKEQPDRSSLVEMTNFLFQCCSEALQDEDGKNPFKSDSED